MKSTAAAYEDQSRFVEEAPDVQDEIDAILPSLMGPVRDPDRAEWIRRSVSRRARRTGMAGGLRSVDLAVFIVLAEHADNSGRNCACSNQTYADEAGFVRSSVCAALKRLEDGAWIRKDHESKGGIRQDGRNPTSTYSVLMLPAEPMLNSLTKTKRRAVLYPDDRQRRFGFNRGVRETDTSNRPGDGHKGNRPGDGHKQPSGRRTQGYSVGASGAARAVVERTGR